ncbi:MAG: flavin monoamine oxidase family protein [Candidatus Binatia bacterium]
MGHSPRLSRRTFLKGAAAAAAAPALVRDADARRMSRHVDVIVVGAGFAGLTAARALVAGGASVVILEANDRVGGRTLNADLGGGKVVEVGGQWVGPLQTEILALATEVGVETFKTYNTGSNLFYYQGTLTPYDAASGIPPVPQGDLTELVTVVLGGLDALANQIPLDHPWDAPGVDVLGLDSQTAETWKLANLATPGARLLFDLSLESVFACEPRDISLLHLLFYIRSGGGLLPLVTTGGGAQDSRFVGGSQLVAQRVADALGKRVVLNAPVRRIKQTPGGVLVETDRRRYRAGRVIVTLPPALCGRVEYDPPLPGLRDQLTQRFPMGSVIKCEAVYPRPFWRDVGLSGQATSDTGPVKITFDNTPPDGSPGVLLGFIEGSEARQWGARPAAERQQAVLASFARYFGAQAMSPTGYIEHDWSAEPWTRGGYAGFMAPGVLTSYGPALRAPVDRIHWAGTETAEVSNGYMDGAVRSGQRAASEVTSG